MQGCIEDDRQKHKIGKRHPKILVENPKECVSPILKKLYLKTERWVNHAHSCYSTQ